MPDFSSWSFAWEDAAWTAGVIVCALLMGLIGARVAIRIAVSWTDRTESSLDNELVNRVARPVRWLLPVIALRAAVPISAIAPPYSHYLEHALVIAAIIGAGWAAVGIVHFIEAVVRRRVDISVDDNLKARGVATSTRVLRSIAKFIIVMLTIGFVLMTFSQVRQVGSAMLASAGVAGIVFGLAAQRSLGALLAGIQIAISQPIRVDDVVVVEGEWGRIEEITLTFVVVRIWDLRRLVVPTTYFLEKPFQNWTRTSAALLGTVELHLDYSVPVDELRAEFKRILDSSDKWDRAIWSLQVTAATDRVMTVRPLFGARNSSDQWDLRCEVREKLLRFVNERYPQALPRLRAEAPSSANAAA